MPGQNYFDSKACLIESVEQQLGWINSILLSKSVLEVMLWGLAMRLGSVGIQECSSERNLGNLDVRSRGRRMPAVRPRLIEMRSKRG